MNDREANLERLLSLSPPIDDNGFTENLMLRLPPRRDIQRIRKITLLCFTLAACAIVSAVPGARRLLAEFVSEFSNSSPVADLSLPTTAVLVALLIWGAVAAATSDA